MRVTPALSGAAKHITIDCRHGTTTVLVVDDGVLGRLPLRIALAKHFAAEGCTCTRSLRKRLGVAA